LGFHNIVTRYLFTLGRRGVLPATLGEAHPVHRSPSRASLCVTALTAAVVMVSALAQLDPVVEIYTWYSGLGAVGVILMMALTSIAVLRWCMHPGAGRGGPAARARRLGGEAAADGGRGRGRRRVRGGPGAGLRARDVAAASAPRHGRRAGDGGPGPRLSAAVRDRALPC